MSKDNYEEYSGSLPDTQPPKDVVAYNELRSCADLYRLHKEGILDIKPDFQRDVVWKFPVQTVFIDSLIKQLPIPSMCFSMDFNTQKWQVVDGLQRMNTIVSFLDDKEWRLSRRNDINSKISGRTNLDIKNGDDESAILYRRIQNLSLPVTVIRCDLTKENHTEYLFTIFHRLNSGGSRLNHQEIRNCIFSGPYNNFLRDLDQMPIWKIIKNLLPAKGARFRSIELILRFISLSINEDNYSGNMPAFLNNYMREQRYADQNYRDGIKHIFIESVTILLKALDKTVNLRINYTLIETALIGISFNLEDLSTANDVHLGQLLTKLANSYEISSDTVKTDSTATTNVKNRIAVAKKIFTI